MRKLTLILVIVGGMFLWTGCPESPPAGGSKPPAGTDSSAPVSSK